MSEQKYTPWFNGDVNPVRPGVYEVQPEHGIRYFSYWNGTRWMFHAISVVRAYLLREQPSSYATERWRGLAADPQGAAA